MGTAPGVGHGKDRTTWGHDPHLVVVGEAASHGRLPEFHHHDVTSVGEDVRVRSTTVVLYADYCDWPLWGPRGNLSEDALPLTAIVQVEPAAVAAK